MFDPRCEECSQPVAACACDCVVCGMPLSGPDAGLFQIEDGRWIPTCSDDCTRAAMSGGDDGYARIEAAGVLARFDAYNAEFERYSADPDIREKYIDEARYACEEMSWELAEALRRVLQGGN